MAEIRINATGGLKLYDADDSHYAQIVAGTITSNTDVLTLGHAAIIAGTKIDLNGNELILDADADTSITADTDDQIDIRISGTDQLTIKDGAFSPVTDNDIDLGTSSLEFKDGYFDGTLHCDVLDLAGTEYTSIGGSDPSSADGDSLGTASAEWSDLYLADGAVIYFGNDQEITLTHSADSGLLLKHTATADDKPINLVLQTGETDMAADDVIGKISFQAPDEGTGTDAILVSGAIQAVAEGDHSSSSNATSLQFMTGASEAATAKMHIKSDGKVGIGEGTPLGTLHVYAGNSTASGVQSNSTALVVEGAANAGIQLLSTNDEYNTINFGDPEDPNIGNIQYYHTNDSMHFVTNTTEALRIDSSGKLSTGAESAPDVNAGGLCLDQNANDTQIFTLKSSDVAHGTTTIDETDTYFSIRKSNGPDGGGQVYHYREVGENAMYYHAVAGGGSLNTGKGSGDTGLISLRAHVRSGTDTDGTMTSNGNMMTIHSHNTVKFIFDAEGDFHADSSSTTFDAYDDAQLARAFDLSHGRGIVDSKFDKFVAYNHEKLAELQLVGRERDGKPNHMVNVCGMQRLHNGAIWQQYEKHEQLLGAVYDLAKEAVGEEKANAILDKHEVKRLQ